MRDSRPVRAVSQPRLIQALSGVGIGGGGCTAVNEKLGRRSVVFSATLGVPQNARSRRTARDSALASGGTRRRYCCGEITRAPRRQTRRDLQTLKPACKCSHERAVLANLLRKGRLCARSAGRPPLLLGHDARV
ncbi:hypothetical protein FA95DRAFT_562640 [Auriscalpium vulgare]|uniref:Uncharacterized protein n=1 Tax=Auriscalpium vulgare TaxID=40419 RepID=A0ACB8RE49_9AGAM|nr:hypothetical protein FA95DRAFT_562640 [Auriscalpium vulgare]